MVSKLKFLLIVAYNTMMCFLLRPKRRSVKMLSADESVEYIRTTGCSLGRFGDGELNMILNYLDGNGSRKSGFQKFDVEMGRRLYEILTEGGSDTDNFCVGIPGCMFSIGTSYLRKNARIFWINYTASYFKRVHTLLATAVNSGKVFLETNVSRFYLSHRDKSRRRGFAEKLKSLWVDRDIIIVEGSQTRLGVGNDLFDSARSVCRILCPATNAWVNYHDILEATTQVAGNHRGGVTR